MQFIPIKQHSDEHFVLKANLDYSNLAAGTIKKFTGSFDGNGYTISNCTIDTTLYSGGTGTAGCVGLFGEVTGTVPESARGKYTHQCAEQLQRHQ